MSNGTGTSYDNTGVPAPSGEMADKIRSLDWSQTALGPPDDWAPPLKTAVRIMLASRYPMFVWWGRDLVNIYNDAYIPVLGKRHPWALGQSSRAVWHEIWDTLGPQTELVLNQGQATWNDQVLLVMERNGFTEETYFTFSYSPLPGDDGRTGAVFCACTEETERVLGARRMVTLRQLAAQTTGAQSAEEACEHAARTLADNGHDVSFALLYLLDRQDGTIKLAATAGIEASSERLISGVEWPFAQAFQGQNVTLTNLEDRRLSGGVWPEPTHTAMLLPLIKGGQDQPVGFLVAGASPRLAFNDSYRGFFELLAGSLASAIANARAYDEEERRRAEALAELDRAKTQFFSNVSHEFRTPLTLLLGPLEDTLALNGDLPGNAKEALTVAHRNGLRLLRLVNSLLDFSRIEAGRTTAVYEPTDLCTLTADLASNFRSATDRAGLHLSVDCPPLREPVWVDREMWEKIILNLLSNAFKFTFEGEISVRVRATNRHVEVSVADTGIGIPEEELPHVFKRFHRVEGARGRTFEGSGIGLALVQELVRFHGGAIEVESTFGQGSTFTVRLPLGNAHLPSDRPGGARQGVSTAVHAQAFVEEALRWLPDLPAADGTFNAARAATSPPAPGHNRATVLIVDDNADMREYVLRLLQDQYDVASCANGDEALQRVLADRPDLVLSDVMMPGLDGFGLLQALRSDPATRTLPVILLSARAGEEARADGMEAGADDYLVKPFTARELLARVAAHLKLARARKDAEEQAQRILESITDAFIGLDQDLCITYVNPEAERITRLRREDMLGRSHWEVFPGSVKTAALREFQRAVAEHVPVEFENYSEQWDRWFRVRAFPSADGGLSVFAADVTEQRKAQAALEDKDRRLGMAQRAGRAGVFDWQMSDNRVIWSPELESLYGLEEGTFSGDFNEWLQNRVVREDADRVLQEAAVCIAERRTEYAYELRAILPSGEHRWLSGQGQFQYDAEGRPQRFIGVNVDIHDRKIAALNAEFLNRLHPVLMQERDPEMLIRHVLQELSGYLSADLAAFGELTPDGGVNAVQLEHCDGRPSVLGTYDMTEFLSADARAALVAGRGFAVNDVETDPHTFGLAENYRKVKIRSFVNAPLVVSTGLKGLLSVNSSRARIWQDHEVQLLRSVASRLFPAVERAGAELALKEQQRFTNSILAGSPTLTYIYDLVERRNVFVSGQSTAILGYAPHEIDAMGSRLFSELLHQDDAPSISEALTKLCGSPSSEVSELEYRMRRKDGSWVWLFSRDRIWKRDAEGVPTQIIGVAVDITERKRTQEVLRERETRMAVAIRNVPLVVYTCDRDLRYTWMGKSHPDIAPDRLIGHRDDEVLPLDDVRDLIAFKQQVLEREHPERRDLSLTIKGRQCHYDMSAEPLRDRDGATVGLIVAALEVTERKQQEQALRLSEERYRAAVKAVSSLIWTNNARGEMEGEQPGWAAFTGQTYEDYQGYGWSKAVHPDDSDPTVQAWNQAVAESRVFMFEHRVRRHDGVWRLFSVRALPVFDEQGSVREWVGVHTDITDERHLLNTVRANEQRLQIVTDNAKVGLVVVNREHRYRFVNKAYAEILGLPSDLVGLRVADVLATVYEEQIRPRLERAFTGESVSYELTLPVRGDSSERRYVVTYEPGTDVDGTPVVVVVIFEITQRVRAEEALAKQLRLTQSITDNATTALFIMDERQQCVFMNPAAEKLTGYTLAETQGRALHDVVHHTRPDGSYYPLAECPIDRAFPERNQTQGEETFVHKDGSFYPVAFTASPMLEGATTVGTVIEVLDVRERNRAEQQLRDSEARFRELAEGMPQVVWTSTPDGTCDYINMRWTELTGFDLAGTQAGVYLDEMPSEDREAFERAAAQGIEEGRPYTVECRFKRRSDGAFRWHLVRAIPIRNSEGHIRKWLGTSTDIDEQKRTEQELRRANQDLEQFAYSASHDLQEPLRNVAIYSQLFSRQYGTNLDGQANRFLGHMTEGAQRMGRLVSDLLAYTQAARFDEEPVTPIDAEKALRKALLNLNQAVEESGGTITFDPMPIVAVGESHLEQLLQNVIGNAVKYRKDTEPPRVHISARPRDDQWEFSVRDNGIGIEPAFHTKVFGMFKRLHTNTSKYSGTGIGLAICQKIVERYGGRIWIESEFGVGTVCHFTLPGGSRR